MQPRILVHVLFTSLDSSIFTSTFRVIGLINSTDNSIVIYKYSVTKVINSTNNSIVIYIYMFIMHVSDSDDHNFKFFPAHQKDFTTIENYCATLWTSYVLIY